MQKLLCSLCLFWHCLHANGTNDSHCDNNVCTNNDTVIEDDKAIKENRIITCDDVEESDLLKSEKQCIHSCDIPHSCNNGILSCYPFDNCIINCVGHSTCNNLRIDFLSGYARLKCTGFNSCNNIIMNSLKQYQYTKYKNITNDAIKKIMQTYDPHTDKNFKWKLPKMKFNTKGIDNIEFEDDDIIVSKHYILAKNVLNKDIMLKINKSKKKCLAIKRDNDTQGSKHRVFGVGNYNITGHSVVYMDDCLHEEIYKYMKSVTIGMLKYFKEYTLQQISNNNDIDDVLKYIANNWRYNWQELIKLSNDLESRVIEYITYKDSDNLGFHTDDESNFTMVTLLDDEDSFDGGMLKFRLNRNELEDEAIKLSMNDIILFPSIADHAVGSVTNGERNVLVIEWWNIGRSKHVGRISAKSHLRELRRRKAARDRAKKKQHWSNLF